MALSDIFICQLSTFYGVSFVKGREPLLFESLYFCWGWNLSWRIAVWFSSHLVAIQSILRTIKIFRPFQVLPKYILKVVLSLDILIISGTVLLTTATLFTPVYTKGHASCLELSIRQPTRFSTVNRLIASIFIVFLPHVVTLLCCALCLMRLIKRNRVAVRRFLPQGLIRRRTHSIKSILAFSVTGLILNILSFTPMIMKASLSIKETNDKDDGISRWRLLYGDLLLREIIITLNSVINPFIFLWRMADFRANVSLTVLQPFFATCFQSCVSEGTLLRPTIDLRDMRINDSNLGNNSPHSPQNSDPNSPQNSDPNSPQNSDPNNPQNSDPNSAQNSDPNNPQNSDPNSAQNSDPNNPQNSDPNSPQNSVPNSPQNINPNSPLNSFGNDLKDDNEMYIIYRGHMKGFVEKCYYISLRDEGVNHEPSQRKTSEFQDIGAASHKIEGKFGDEQV